VKGPLLSARARLREPLLATPGAGPLPLITELTEEGSRRPLRLPDGVTREELFGMLASLSIDDAPPSELEAYLTEDFERFVHTWSLTGDVSGRALEIGANPYFTTVLLRELSDLDLELVNSFDPDAQGTASQRVTYRPLGADGPITEELGYHQVNIERHRLPFDDATFDLVLFCEVMEHLLSDAVGALLELKRVLKPGGRLVLTTPNVARLENVARLAAGANLYDPYSGYGPYGRHNREYTRHEVHRLLTFLGFHIADDFTADVHPHRTSHFVDPARLADLVEHRHEDLGQYLFFVATNDGPPTEGRPSFLYRSLPPGEIVPYE
jgi:SAM-dependent methyltransferase